jgi:hypothetical protein
MDSYLTNATAATLISQLGLTRLAAKTTAEQDTLLLLASIDVDAAGPWQGRKYDPEGAITGTVQEREFPRVPHEDQTVVWDWDEDADAAVVPWNVNAAVAIQANELADTDRQAHLQKLRDGLAAQSAGSLSESYRAEAIAAGPQTNWQRLSDRAKAMLARYRATYGEYL